MIHCRERLEKDFSALARFGSLETGGFTRVAFSLEDIAARDWLQGAMEAAGLEVVVDAVGNIRGRRPGREDLPPVMLGSHLDTVPQGGNYDGSVGVLAALEIVRTLNDRKQMTKRPIEVINFSAEESSRFGVATIGSKALTGRLDRAFLKNLRDKDGFSLFDTLASSGYRPDEIDRCSLAPGDVHAFIELHIEQGPVLEDQACPIGIVTSIAAPTRFKVVVTGCADHSGNTPMNMRKDALVGASEIILSIEKIAATSGPSTVATVGYLYVSPGAMNVIPGQVEFGIDIRDVCMDGKTKAAQRVVALIDSVAAERELEITYQQLCNDRPVELSDKIINVIDASATDLGIPYLKMTSGAGHDAMNMAGITNVGMIFIPSVGGISHNIQEYSRMEDICTGTELLLEATLRLADE